MSKKTEKKAEKKTTIGGQALFEGIMMRGVSTAAMAVRKKDGSVQVDEWELPEKKWYNKALFVRGCFNFVETLREGMKCMNKSMEISGMLEDDGEPQSKVDIWIEKHLGEKAYGVIGTLLTVIMVAAMLFVFLFVPSWLFAMIEKAAGEADVTVWKAPFEGVLRLILFVGYMAIVAQMKDIKRTYEYHGAEHKTIACYEAGKPLTVENIKPMTRFHPRCGTSFIIITLLVSILVFMIVPINPAEWWGVENTMLAALLRVLIKLPFLPVVVGISYELIKLAGRYTNPFTKIISAPGLWMQRLTTREPDDSQIEIAIAAVTPCLPKDGEDDNW
ncbi:MAG: DUF1385 domain-containing protein [Lachnospiraceae bacterium]|nr:DUF1385 domain-containing protein [Ruminococcus sp.]MCM1275719.1 DUF1385 domain-containing protein [Lachnospiraceae bacterium]